MKRAVRSVLLHPSVESFDREVLRSPLPVLVDFWAPWCPPCMILKPEIERLAADLEGRARVALINVDEEPELAGILGVQCVPALMIVKRGRLVDRWSGYTPRVAMLARLEMFVACS